MRSQPKRGVAFAFDLALPSQANPLIFQSSPTLATGDVKVSKDAGALANLASLPTASGKLVRVSLSASEMDADTVTVVFSDAAGDEWCDVIVEIHTGSDPTLLASTTIATLASQTSFTLTSGSADDDTYNGCDMVFTDAATPSQQAVRKVADYVGSTRTITLDAAPGFTIATGDYVDVLASRAATQASVDTIDNLVDDLESRIGTPSDLGSGATVAANLIDIEGQTDDIGAAGAGLTALASAADLATLAGYVDNEVAAIQTYLTNNLGVAGAAATEAGGTGDHLTAIPWNAAWDEEVQSEVADALAAYDPPTNAEMEARTLVAASYATASSLATVAAYLDTEITDILVTTNKLATAMELDGGVYRFTTNALEQSPTGGNSPEDIASAVRAELAAELTLVDVAISTRHAAGAAVASVSGDVTGKVLGGGSGTISGTGARVSLASDGLDSVSITAPSGVASNFREMIVQVWRRFFRKATQTDSQIKTYADDGSTVVTTQTVSDDGTTETQGAAS